MPYHDKVTLGELFRELDKKRNKTWIGINELCRKKNLERSQLTKMALDHYHKEYWEALRNPDTPEGIKALMVLQQILLALA